MLLIAIDGRTEVWAGDVVRIEMEEIGSLTTSVVRGLEALAPGRAQVGGGPH